MSQAIQPCGWKGSRQSVRGAFLFFGFDLVQDLLHVLNAFVVDDGDSDGALVELF